MFLSSAPTCYLNNVFRSRPSGLPELVHLSTSARLQGDPEPPPRPNPLGNNSRFCAGFSVSSCLEMCVEKFNMLPFAENNGGNQETWQNNLKIKKRTERIQ